MNIQNLLYTICIIFIIINIMYYRTRAHKWTSGLIGMGSGVAVLIPLHYLLEMSGLSLAMNYFTILFSMAFGIPGVIFMMIDSILF